ncbi:MAG TPA: ferritin-like domain-containing protein, partial [Actinocrinis sp.]|nr:ferritin-like domain-containing protein [Actinocrinis sp.]
MTETPQWQLQISEAQLSSMTKELDEAHRESIPVMRKQAALFAEELADTTPATPERRLGRRGFLVGLGGVGATLALAACSSSSSKGSAAASSSTSAMASPSMSAAGGSQYTGDLKVVALATALENQAVAAYTAALAAATAGKLGTVPAAVGTFAQTAMAQHADHAKAWNAVLSSANVPTITGIPLSNQPQTLAALSAVTTVGGVANLALDLENQAAQTY